MTRPRVYCILAAVVWVCAAMIAAADRHVAECDQQSCAREDVPQDDSTPTDAPNLVLVHAHGCSCHTGIALVFELPCVVGLNHRSAGGFISVPRIGRSHEPPPTRPPIVRV